MAAPAPRPRGSPPPRKRAPLPLPSSPAAAQRPSLDSPLTASQPKHRAFFGNIPILGSIESFFINRAIKEEYIEEIRNKFILGAIEQKIAYLEAFRVFNTHFLPFLSKCNVENLPLFESLLTDPAGIQFSMQHLTTKPIPYLINAFATLPLVTRLIGRLGPEDQRNYLQVWIQNAQELTPNLFKQLVGGFTAHLKYAEGLQNCRPEVFDQDASKTIRLKTGFEDLLSNPKLAMQAQRLAPFDSVLRDVTVIENRQILMAGIASLYLGATYKGDSTVPELVPRSIGVGGKSPSFSLLNQVGAPLSFPEGPPWTILENFQAHVEIYVTDPFSMETRRVRMPLPISGRITIGELKKQLEILKKVVNDPAQIGKRAMPESFIEFSQQLGVAFGQALGDFNSTPNRPKGTTANAQPENAAAIAHPNSRGYAVQSASLHNLFRLQDGTLSLIPSGPGEQHKKVGSLSKSELKQATGALLGRPSSPVPMSVPEGVTDDAPLKTAQLSLEISEETIEESPFLLVKTTISLDGKTTTSPFYYPVAKKGGQIESIDAVKQRIVQSGLFERDLLLAKATFIEQHVVTTFKMAQKLNPEGTQWVLAHAERVIFLMGNRFSNADQERYLNSMLEIVRDMPQDDFTKLSQMLDNIVNTALSIQAERPKLYPASEKLDLVMLVYDPKIVPIVNRYPFLADIYIEEICEMTILMNTQKLHENVGMYFTQPTSMNRMFSNLTPLHERFTALSVEKHTPFQIFKDGDEITDFHAGIDLYVTTEKTMETRHLYAPFPFEGNMTQTEARHLLKLLEDAIASPKRFAETYAALKLDPQLQSSRKETFLAWIDTLEREYAKVLFDFNPTPTRPTMSFALETKESQAALEQPQNVAAAVEVVKARNIYLVDGKLSLLPKAIAQSHQVMAMIAPQELSDSTQLLLGQKSGAIDIAITPQLTARVSLKTEPKQFSDIKGIQLETTVEGDKTKLTRTTLYLLKPGQTPDEKINEIIASRLFERDLLLAKAEFIGAHAQL